MATYKELADFYFTLADPNRIRILNVLRKRSLCVCEITELLDLAPSTVSEHLRILKNTDLIQQDKDGKWVNYSLNLRAKAPHIRALLTDFDTVLKAEDFTNYDESRVSQVDRYNLHSV